MADNRIYLRCKNCGEAFFLGKRLGDGYYTQNFYYTDGSMLKCLNKFYEKHQWENTDRTDKRTDRWESLDCFEIVYEMDDDFEIKVVGYFK